MPSSVKMEPVEEKIHGGVGRCKFSFWFAVAHDILGVFIMMVGVFGGLAIHDLFVYAGGIIIFLSLIWWVFWYSGNIDVPPEELEDDVGMIKLKRSGLNQVVRRMSGRIASGIRSSFRRSGRSFRRGPAGVSAPSNAGTNLPLSTIYDTTITAPSTEGVYDTV
ncbi:transmembrane protein 238-like [Mugil cephalus]|uniref:transmembrane protein 238-like n=1 Tax=Mugil cephalus TaxID=48193 RepID=UPI001FB83414|nr:transmembrane protein 238-like [Mugil cephalus]